ncbi:MAG: hypothetical protein HYS66_06145 [Deltaproteobacteria bacterium]|nr:hypothetical protein [Deltaproteobacteria bacterium]
MKRLTVERVGVAFLLSLALLVSAASPKVLPNSATLLVAGAARDFMPLLEEAIDVVDENPLVPGPSYLQPTIFCPALLDPASKRSFSQTAGSAKKNLKLYQLNGVLLI